MSLSMENSKPFPREAILKPAIFDQDQLSMPSATEDGIDAARTNAAPGVKAPQQNVSPDNSPPNDADLPPMRSPAEARLNPVLFLKKMLVVDDLPELCTLLRKMLEAEGAVVTCCSTVEEARSQVMSGEFDAVICDIALGDGSGLDVYAALKQRSGSANMPPILLTTGFGYDPQHVIVEVSRDLRATGAPDAHVLLKPFRRDELIAKLQESMGRGPPSEVAA